MSKINILSKDVYNKIAAGEVVEKPASVVKELVENSIDAGATNITIEILDGGIKQIKVSDNGCGIDYDDFNKVFLAHATSKVKNISDLAKIGTLGFRGEALSSIASVSKITLSSKTENSNEGYQVKVSGGEMGEITPIGATTGTYIIIEDLFFNIPARKKFLRKPKLEENDITNYVARLILANPNITFKYIADNKIVYQSFGTGLYDAIYAIYGKSIVDNIIEIKFERDKLKFSGYIGKPSFSKPNRTYQTLIINGRYVINQTISTSIYRAYENFLMKGNFPFFVLNLEIPLDEVDVNVHPNKLEVKFEDNNSIFGVVYSEISSILYDLNTIKTVRTEEIPLTEESVDTSKLCIIEEGSSYNTNKTDDCIEEVSINTKIEYEANKNDNEIHEFKKNIIESNKGQEYINPIITSSLFDYNINSPRVNDSFVSSDIPKEKDDIFQDESNHEEIGFLSSSINTIQENFIEKQDSFKIIGTLFNTYILIEQDETLYLIDQHAGHERILFDKFNIELENKEVAIQPLMISFILDLNTSESQFINNNIEALGNLGFEISDFGDCSFKVETVPLLLENINLGDFFDSLLHDIDNNLILNKKDMINEYIAKKACKSAVKGNDPLSKKEVSILIEMLKNNSTILLCPHGRPIIIQVTKKEIEKWFKRIV